ncbi:CocE/NonD family hydrolase [Intrasporangium sp.]|uniref:CocE/NonD family hydrolase n=1 Tax=Intrasporangium sp. TaxID=1925024 RepID=UPI0032217A33
MQRSGSSSRLRQSATAVRGCSRRAAARVVDAFFGLEPGNGRPVVVRDLATPMPDGVNLMGDLYRPAGLDGPLPVVLIRLPYGRGGPFKVLFGSLYARHGFQVFIQAIRGTFGSGGQFRPFTTEHEDGLATVKWVRAQPWCDGRVAMTGASYFGHTQWAVAPYVDPPLECVSPHITAARISAAFYDHGVPQLQNALQWSAQVGRQEWMSFPAQMATTPVFVRRTRRAMQHLPLQALDVAVAGAPVAFWRDFVAHAGPRDDFWSGSDHSGADLGRMPPTSMVTGWWDPFVREQLTDYTALRAAGVPARLLVGPWRHGEPDEFSTMLQNDLAWLGSHLNGGAAPTGAPVRVNLQPTSAWLELDAWPPPGARSRLEYLSGPDSLVGRPPTEPCPPSRFTYDPADPTPSVGGPVLTPPSKQHDNAELESRADVLVFTGPPVGADLDVVGPVHARIYLRTKHPHADLFVRLCDVDEKQVSRNVVDGIRRLDPATVPAADVTVGPDGVLAVELELFPTAYRFRAGHRLRVQVAGGAFPRYARNLGTGERFGTGTTMRANGFEVLHDPEHPSRLELTVLSAPAG